MWLRYATRAGKCEGEREREDRSGTDPLNCSGKHAHTSFTHHFADSGSGGWALSVLASELLPGLDCALLGARRSALDVLDLMPELQIRGTSIISGDRER